MQVAAAATTATVQQCRRLGEGGKVLCKPHQKWWLADPAKFRVNVMLCWPANRQEALVDSPPMSGASLLPYWLVKRDSQNV